MGAARAGDQLCAASAAGGPVTVVAIVPAKDRSRSLGDTVTALRAVGAVDRILVVDDGSTDETAGVARGAGATVLRLDENVGKGGAVTAGVEATPDATVYLLIDDDVGRTAAVANQLLGAVLDGQADMTIGVLPSAAGKGGFGFVSSMARRAIGRATGFRPRTPLSGQRAITADLLRSVLPLAPRFGLETALTIDAMRKGARIVEVDVGMEHQHMGRSLAGFRHRAGQGADIVRAVWSRLTTPRHRLALVVLVTVVALVWALWSGSRWEPASEALATRPDKVVVFGMPHLGLDDIERGRTPQLDALIDDGALAAMSVRTFEGRPSTVEGYASLGAGARLRSHADGGVAYAGGAPLEGGSAAAALERRTGRPVQGEVVVVGGPATIRLNSGKYLPSEPGAMGQALHDAGLRTAVVGNADSPDSGDGTIPRISRPAAIAVADDTMAVDIGAVSRSDVLERDPSAPFGYRADAGKVMAASRRALAEADVVFIDPGDLDRATYVRRLALDRAADAHWEAALRRTDDLLGQVRAALPPRTLLLVVAPSPPTSGWNLTPVVAVGPGVPHGHLHSPSTKRAGVVTITDIAPTILDALGVQTPTGMIGAPLRYRAGEPDVGGLRAINRDASYRERIAYPVTLTYIVFQAALYLAVMLAFSRRGGVGRGGPVLRWTVLAIAAFPLASFLVRAVPGVSRLGGGGIAVLLLIDAVIVLLAARSRRHPLSPLGWILGATAAVIMIDVATGVRLQTSSLLGYSLHIAARFYGLGNAAFAVLAACSLLAVAIHVHYAPRRREALVTAGAFLALVVVVDGAPSLGDDVGGILTLVPAFGLTMLVMAGRRLSWRAVAIAAVATVGLLAVAVGVDLLREPEARTHLGRFATDVGDDGSGTFVTTVVRKVSTNVRILGTSVWTWMLPIIAIFTIYLLVWERRWEALLPRGTALRAGAVGALTAGLLGFAVNDSGVIVTALVFVYIGPFLTLLALHHEGDRRMLHEAEPPAEARALHPLPAAER